MLRADPFELCQKLTCKSRIKLKFVLTIPTLIIVIMVTAGGPVFGLDPDSNPLPSSTAVEALYAAIDDPAAIESAEQTLQHSQSPAPAKQMYAAVLKSLRAQSSFWPVKRMRLIQEALAEMDAALGQDPQNYEFRMLRASTWYDLPSFFNKRAAAQAELEQLVAGFDAESAVYSDKQRRHWLNFFLENHLSGSHEAPFRELFVKLGGNLKDLY